jgi:antitoxin MazE
MLARVRKWGNSLAVRIPKAFADEAGLEQDGEVKVSLVDGRIVIEPSDAILTLDQLLAQVTEENLHREVNTGPAIGREAW